MTTTSPEPAARPEAELLDQDLALLRGLVEIPSVSGQEGEAVEWLVARLAERGFNALVDDAGNAVGEIGAGPVQVCLLGHIDTVPGEIPVLLERGELVGRGAVDAKGALAAFVAAATAPPPGVRITVVGAVEEESPTSAGARHRATLPAPDWCVVGEPSGWDAVTIAYKGRLALRVTLERPARHGAAPGLTISEEAFLLWNALRRAAEERGSGERAFDRLDCRLEGIASGGDGLVERAELRIGYRLPPGLATDEVEREAGALVGAAVVVERLAPEEPARYRGAYLMPSIVVERLAAEEPVRSERSSLLARSFARAIAAAGGRATFKRKSGTSDMNVLAPAWRCPIVAYGPGDSGYDHTPEERLPLADYARSIAVLRGVLRLAGGPPDVP